MNARKCVTRVCREDRLAAFCQLRGRLGGPIWGKGPPHLVKFHCVAVELASAVLKISLIGRYGSPALCTALCLSVRSFVTHETQLVTKLRASDSPDQSFLFHYCLYYSAVQIRLSLL